MVFSFFLHLTCEYQWPELASFHQLKLFDHTHKLDADERDGKTDQKITDEMPGDGRGRFFLSLIRLQDTACVILSSARRLAGHVPLADLAGWPSH